MLSRSDRHKLLSPEVASLVFAALRLRLTCELEDNKREGLPTIWRGEKSETKAARKERTMVNPKDTIDAPYSIDFPPFDSPEVSG